MTSIRYGASNDGDDSDVEILNGKECNHNKDRCGCYLALIEEKALLEYKLNKYQGKQKEFLEAIKQAALEAISIASKDEDLVVELTKLQSILESYESDISLPNNHKTNKQTSTPTTTTTTTSTISSKHVEYPSSPTQDNKATKRIKTSDNKPRTDTDTPISNNSNEEQMGNNKKTPNNIKTLRTNSDLIPEDLAAIFKSEDEAMKQERESLTNDDFQIALSFQPRQCPLCLDDVEVDFILALQQCRHEYCRECIIHYVTDKITSKSFPINCPLPECKKEMSVYDMEMLLDAKMMEKYHEFVFSSTIESNPETYSCCPTADCGYVFLYEKGDSSDFNCEKCNKRYCLTCRADFHKGSTCEQYQQWLKENGQGDQLFEQFAQGMKLKKCPKCNRWTEKISGCNHMSCKCGQKFCYNCGNSYPCKCGQDPHVAMGMPAVAAPAAPFGMGHAAAAVVANFNPFPFNPAYGNPLANNPFNANPLINHNPNINNPNVNTPPRYPPRRNKRRR